MIEEMIAAGWINECDVDEDYQEHIAAFGDIDYGQWQVLTERLAYLNELYSNEVAPYYSQDCDRVPYEVEKRGDELLRQMVSIEAALGY